MREEIVCLHTLMSWAYTWARASMGLAVARNPGHRAGMNLDGWYPPLRSQAVDDELRRGNTWPFRRLICHKKIDEQAMHCRLILIGCP